MSSSSASASHGRRKPNPLAAQHSPYLLQHDGGRGAVREALRRREGSEQEHKPNRGRWRSLKPVEVAGDARGRPARIAKLQLAPARAGDDAAIPSRVYIARRRPVPRRPSSHHRRAPLQLAPLSPAASRAEARRAAAGTVPPPHGPVKAAPPSPAARAEKVRETHVAVLNLERAFAEISSSSSNGDNDAAAFFGGDSVMYLDLTLGCSLPWVGTLRAMLGVEVIDAARTPLLAVWTERFGEKVMLFRVLPQLDEAVAYAKKIQTYRASAAAKKLCSSEYSVIMKLEQQCQEGHFALLTNIIRLLCSRNRLHDLITTVQSSRTVLSYQRFRECWVVQVYYIATK